MIITIDGPTASGKSTAANLLAHQLGFYYLPTGWLYRAVSYLLVTRYNYTHDMLSKPDEKDVAMCLDPARLIYTYDDNRGGTLFYDGLNITPSLKDVSIDRSVAIISPLPMVRDMVVKAQRNFAKTHDSVVEGRDTGSVVFPYATYKFYLTSSVTVRALRWQHDQKLRGNNFTLSQAQQEITERDRKDLERPYCPLTVPVGAIQIDNTDLTAEQTVALILSYIKQ